MPDFNIEEAELADFEAVVRLKGAACDYKRDNKTGALLVSFDIDLKPFLCVTKGYNKEWDRVFIDCILLKRVQALIKYVKPGGGRVFMSSRGVWTKDEKSNRVHLIAWKLPRKSSILK